MNAITYKEVFPLIKENKIWLGNGFNGGNAYFRPVGKNMADYASGVYDDKTGLVSRIVRCSAKRTTVQRATNNIGVGLN